MNKSFTHIGGKYFKTNSRLYFESEVVSSISHYELKSTQFVDLNMNYLLLKNFLLFKGKIIKPANEIEWDYVKDIGNGFIKTKFSIIYNGIVVKRVFKEKMNYFLREVRIIEGTNYLLLPNGIVYKDKVLEERDKKNQIYNVKVLSGGYIQTPYSLIYKGKILRKITPGAKEKRFGKNDKYLFLSGSLFSNGKFITEMSKKETRSFVIQNKNYISTHKKLIYKGHVIFRRMEEDFRGLYELSSIQARGEYCLIKNILFYRGRQCKKFISDHRHGDLVVRFPNFVKEHNVFYVTTKTPVSEKTQYFKKGKEIYHTEQLKKIIERSEKYPWSIDKHSKYSEEYKSFVRHTLLVHKYSEEFGNIPKDVVLFKILPMTNEIDIFLEFKKRVKPKKIIERKVEKKTKVGNDGLEYDKEILKNIMLMERSPDSYNKKRCKNKKLKARWRRKEEAKRLKKLL